MVWSSYPVCLHKYKGIWTLWYNLVFLFSFLSCTSKCHLAGHARNLYAWRPAAAAGSSCFVIFRQLHQCGFIRDELDRGRYFVPPSAGFPLHPVCWFADRSCASTMRGISAIDILDPAPSLHSTFSAGTRRAASYDERRPGIAFQFLLRQ